LKIYSRGLAEVAGLAVHPRWQGAGVGRALLEMLTAEARAQGLHEVLALTRKPAFFLKLGFVPAEREQFPLKVWADCARCPRQNCCDEVAVVLRLWSLPLTRSPVPEEIPRNAPCHLLGRRHP